MRPKVRPHARIARPTRPSTARLHVWHVRRYTDHARLLGVHLAAWPQNRRAEMWIKVDGDAVARERSEEQALGAMGRRAAGVAHVASLPCTRTALKSQACSARVLCRRTLASVGRQGFRWAPRGACARVGCAPVTNTRHWASRTQMH